MDRNTVLLIINLLMMLMNLFMFYSVHSYFESVSECSDASDKLTRSAIHSCELISEQYDNVMHYYNLVRDEEKSAGELYKQMQKNYFELAKILDRKKESDVKER